MYGVENERLNFVIQRDGMTEAIDYAKRTLKVYRTALFRSRKHGFSQPHHASIPEYRRLFVMSCLAFRKFIRENKS